jgi:antitoxin (DNA-binding transcriptional repressor) of toxin-antitoxin stability system
MDLEPKGIRKVLFRLPEVLAAVAAGWRIHVTEGENDVLPLVIIADKDAPGRTAAGKVGGQLRAVAAA